MHQVVKASLILASIVALLSVVIYATGFHQNLFVLQIVFLVLAIGVNVAVVLWALGKTAPVSPYGGQLLNAAGIGLLGGALITLVSWVLLSVVFPDALGEMRTAAIAYMDSAGMSQDEYAKSLATLDRATPWSQSLPGGIGTFFTSVVTGAIAAIWKRKK